MSTKISDRTNHRFLSGVNELIDSLGSPMQNKWSEIELQHGSIDIILTKPDARNFSQVEFDVADFEPVRFYHPEYKDISKPKFHKLTLIEHNVLLLVDDKFKEFNTPKNWVVLNVVNEANPLMLNIINRADSKVQNLVSAIDSLDIQPEIILLAIDGSQFSRNALLGNQLEYVQALLNSLFSICKIYYNKIRDGQIRVASVVYHAWGGQKELNPITGLFGGFIKSLHRDIPDAFLAAVHSDSSFFEALTSVEKILDQPLQKGELAEVFVHNGRMQRQHLAETKTLSAQGGRVLIDSDTVILATGGARGVTAVLLEELLRRHRCTVIAFGRTDLSCTPKQFLDMSEKELADYESKFYRTELAENKTSNIIELKRIFQNHLAANEIYQNMRRMAELGGKFEYVSVDITDQEAIDSAIAIIVSKYGKVSLFLHGAGIQISRSLQSKTINDFNSVVSAKLAGLRNIYQALQHYQNNNELIVHLLSSSFSFWGNDGQPDYGAANEAMNRLAEALNMSATGNWSTLAWLGWAGIGMTRGSEYATLAEQRDLYPVTKDEGQRLFSALMQSQPKYSINVLATPKEIRFYNVTIKDERETDRTDSVNATTIISLSLDNAAYLKNHIVAGVPTVPGAVELIHCVIAVLRYLPDSQFVQINNARFISFLKSYPNQANEARIVTERIADSQKETMLFKAAVESDFIHSSGRVLRRDIRNFEAVIQLYPEKNQAGLVPEIVAVKNAKPGFFIYDPYIHGQGNVALNGVFDCLREITINEYGQAARLQFPPQLRSDPHRRLLILSVLLDGLWCLAVMRPHDHGIPLYVPVESQSVKLYMDFSEQVNIDKFLDAQLLATKPEPLPDRSGAVLIRYAVALDSQGEILAINEGIIAHLNN